MAKLHPFEADILTDLFVPDLNQSGEVTSVYFDPQELQQYQEHEEIPEEPVSKFKMLVMRCFGYDYY